MKKLAILAILTGMLMSAGGCAPVLITAPPASDVRLLAELEPAASRVTMKNWYVLWGLVPLTNNNTADVIGKHGLQNVRAKTYFTFVDALISYALGGLTIMTNTVEIEGNLAK